MNYHAKCPKKGRTAEKPKNWFWRCSVPENLRVVRRLVPIATFVFIWRKGWWNRFSRSNEMVNEREMEILRWRTPNTANHDRSILAVHRIPESARPKRQTGNRLGIRVADHQATAAVLVLLFLHYLCTPQAPRPPAPECHSVESVLVLAGFRAH